MSLRIFVEEEYGYRSWIWVYPNDRKQLIADWKAGKAPLDFFDPSTSEFSGQLMPLRGDIRDEERQADAYLHTHEPEDSILAFRDEVQIPQDPARYNAGPTIWPRKPAE